jgi:H+-transporting ATPase
MNLAGDPPGLTSAEAAHRAAEIGTNTISEKATPRWRAFAAKFWSPVPWMLEAALLLQLALGAYVEAVVVGALLVFNATLAFIQEGRAGAALAALKERLAPTAHVRRDGAWVRLAASELVPGDAIRLPLGAIVPADATIGSGSVLVDQSMLTGESLPIDAEPASRVYAGSIVRRGEAIAEVTATGPRTHFGRVAELVRISRAPSTEQAAIFAVTRNLAIVNGTLAVLMVGYAYASAFASGDLVRLALTALLATIPLALPATFTLSAAFSAQVLAQRGVLLTRLSAAHEVAAMDLLCADKTGTLTRNTLEVAEVVPLPGFDRERVLALAALASSESDRDPIDSAVRSAAATQAAPRADERALRFVPFDPATRTSAAFAIDRDGNEVRIVKGALEALAGVAEVPAGTARMVEEIAARGHRVIALATGTASSLRLAGLIALSDTPREDSAGLVAALRALGVRTVMATGDSPVTAAAVARKVGIEESDVFARLTPEDKHRLVKTLQGKAHVVGMCGDGTNDAPALRQAQVGIAVSRATDAAKAAAGLVLTEPGLGSLVHAVREGRVGFQRLVAYALNMLVKKIEIVLFLAIGLMLTGDAVLTPALMVLLFLTNDFLAMSLTTDRPSPATSPSRWRMLRVTVTALGLAACKLGFTTGILALGAFGLGLALEEIRTLAFVGLVSGSQALLYVVRERGSIWSSRPGMWMFAASGADLVFAAALAVSGTLMAPLPWGLVGVVVFASAGLALVLDQVKLALVRASGI